MAVRIRMKKFGRSHRPFFRVCAVDSRRPRDGRVLEELGTYDPLVPDTDARALLNGERIRYWLSTGAQPSEKVRVLIKKYGLEGTRALEQKEAVERLAQSRRPRQAPVHIAPAAREETHEASPAEPEPPAEA